MRRCLAWTGVAAAFLLILQPEPTRARQLGSLIGCEARYGETVAQARARCEYDSAENQASRMLENARQREQANQPTQALLADLQRRPALPAAQNRLLGRWRAPRAAAPAASSDPFAALLSGLVGGGAGMCSLLFTSGEVEFGPTRWAVTDATGREDLGPVSYRAASASAVAALPAQGVQMMVFDILDANRVRLSGDANCILTRVGGPPASIPIQTPPPVATGPVRPPAEICRRDFLNELGRVGVAEVTNVVRQRFRDNETSVTPGTRNLRLMARGSPCDDPRIGGVIYDFDAAGVLRAVTHAWQRPQTTFAETVASLTRISPTPPRITGGARADGATGAYRYSVEDRPAQQIVMVTFSPLGAQAAPPPTVAQAAPPAAPRPAQPAPAAPQGLRLPIAEGVWVRIEDSCAATTNVFAYGANRFGSVYFYGPNYSLGPADETEAITQLGRGQNGFTVVNTGPIEVIPRPNGLAQVRAVSAADGVAWVETVRLCAPPTLLPRLRQALIRLRLLPAQ